MLESSRAKLAIGADEALQRILYVKGISSFEASSESSEMSELSSPESLAAHLHAADVAARLIRVSSVAELHHVNLPALLHLSDGSWAILRSRGPVRYLVEGLGGGIRRMKPRLLNPLLAGEVIELAILPPRSSSLIRQSWSILARERYAVARIIAASMLLQLLVLTTPLITRVVVDNAVSNGLSSIWKLLALAAILVAGSQALTGWIRNQILIYLEARLNASLSRAFLQHLLRLPLPFLQSRTSGDLAQGSLGVSQAQSFVGDRLMRSLLDAILGTVYLAFMAFLIPALTVVVGLTACVIIGLTITAAVLLGPIERQAVRARSEKQGYLAQLLAGIETIKSNTGEEQSLSMLRRYWLRELRLNQRSQQIAALKDVGVDSLSQLLVIMLFAFASSGAGSHLASTGTLIAFIQYSSAFISSLGGVGSAYLSFVQVRPKLEKAEEILAVKPIPKERIARRSRLVGPVVLDDVWFRYHSDAPWVLKEFGLKVNPGECIRIDGPSGWGKSTLLRLIAGFYVPSHGVIRIESMPPGRARVRIAHLPQFVRLYAGSLLKNLQLFSGNAPISLLMDVAEETGLQEWISKLPMGYNTLVSEAGSNFSGGQRQFIALTAVLASNVGLLLLDEPLANLDVLSKRRFLTCSRWTDKTVIYAAHEEMTPVESASVKLSMAPGVSAE